MLRGVCLSRRSAAGVCVECAVFDSASGWVVCTGHCEPTELSVSRAGF